MRDFWEINHTKWWKIRCMQLDVVEYINGNMTRQEFLECMEIDMKELQKAIDEERIKDG